MSVSNYPCYGQSDRGSSFADLFGFFSERATHMIHDKMNGENSQQQQQQQQQQHQQHQQHIQQLHPQQHLQNIGLTMQTPPTPTAAASPTLPLERYR